MCVYIVAPGSVEATEMAGKDGWMVSGSQSVSELGGMGWQPPSCRAVPQSAAIWCLPLFLSRPDVRGRDRRDGYLVCIIQSASSTKVRTEKEHSGDIIDQDSDAVEGKRERCDPSAGRQDREGHSNTEKAGRQAGRQPEW